MVRRRKEKKSDQYNTETAFQILRQAMLDHPEIEQSLWAGACWSALVNGYLLSEIPYDQFCEDFDNAKEFYKERWESK
jgi:hypothetical protein